MLGANPNSYYKHKGEKIMFKSFAWDLNKEGKAIVDGLISCAPITGRFHGRENGVIPI